MLEGLASTTIVPLPSTEAIENLKFSECLSANIAAEVFSARFNDQPAVKQALKERRRIVVEGDSQLPSTTTGRHNGDFVPDGREK